MRMWTQMGNKTGVIVKELCDIRGTIQGEEKANRDQIMRLPLLEKDRVSGEGRVSNIYKS